MLRPDCSATPDYSYFWNESYVTIEFYGNAKSKGSCIIPMNQEESLIYQKHRALARYIKMFLYDIHEKSEVIDKIYVQYSTVQLGTFWTLFEMRM